MVINEIAVTIQKEAWMIKFVSIRQMPKKTWGDCDWGRRIIRVRHDLSPKNFLDTLIHEIRHAQHPVMFEAESFVTTTSTEIAQILMATGKIEVRNKRQRSTRR
jgi:hypothetical protein